MDAHARAGENEVVQRQEQKHAMFAHKIVNFTCDNICDNFSLLCVLLAGFKKKKCLFFIASAFVRFYVVVVVAENYTHC